MTIRNSSSVSVDFNNEVKGIMSETNTTEGREIKLAVAVYQSPERFNVSNLLNAALNKSENQRKALAANSEAFKDKLAKLDTLKKEAKKASTQRALTIAFEIKDIDRGVKAAVAMLNRALIGAYWLKSANAVVHSINGTTATIEYDGEVDGKSSRIKERITRGDLAKFGTKVAKERGLVKKKEVAGAGNKPVSFKDSVKKAATVTDAFKLASESVATMSPTERDEFTSHKSFGPALANMMRAQFAHEGVIDVADIADFLRSHVNGVRIETGSRKPDARKARAA
jgi:hypothetical protein